MAAEYSYFRAEGQSLSAIQAVNEAVAELKTGKVRLAARFGADSVAGYYSAETRRFEIEHFHFKPPKKPPAGWVDGGVSGTGSEQYARPAPGSADYFNMVMLSDLMTRAARRLSLEDVFKISDMPMHDMQDGQRPINAFVRFTMAEVTGGPKPGQISGPPTDAILISGGPWRTVDPIAFMEMDGDYYIRVPNKKGTDTPVFTPPEAAPVSYDDMLKVDAREQNKRYNEILARTYEGYCC